MAAAVFGRSHPAIEARTCKFSFSGRTTKSHAPIQILFTVSLLINAGTNTIVLDYFV